MGIKISSYQAKFNESDDNCLRFASCFVDTPVSIKHLIIINGSE